MCGRFAINAETNDFLEELVAEHGIQALPHWRDYLPAYNIKPTSQIPVIMHSDKLTADVITTARWGLVPPFTKTIQDAPRTTFNARAESAMTSEKTGRASMWRTPLTKGRRCLIPASGFFEWTGAKAPKVPHWLHPDGPILMFAGLYSWWADPSKPEDDEDRWTLTATILTMPTVPGLAVIHDRNPVGLPESHWWSWIDPQQPGDQALVDDAVASSRPVMASLEEYVVAPLKGDGPELLQPVAG